MALKSGLVVYVNNDALGNLLRGLSNRLEPLRVPPLSLEMLISAICLFIGSSLYAVFCPQRIKQFSRDEWCQQLNHSIITYWPHAWRFTVIRLIAFCLYVVGGLLAAWVIAFKLIETAYFIVRNS